MNYIHDQFEQRFPKARISVTFADDEMIVVSVNGVPWIMEIGSDDDEFVFSRDGEVIAFPFED